MKEKVYTNTPVGICSYMEIGEIIKILSKFKETDFLQIDYYGDEYWDAFVRSERLETDEEEALRLERIEARKKATEVYEREEFARLKAKYGSI